MRKSRPVFIYKPSATAAQLPHLAGLPYGLRIRLRTPWAPWVYAETLAGKLIGLVPASCIDRS